VLQRSARSRVAEFDAPFTPRTLRRHANESFRSNAVETANWVTRRMGSLCSICLHQPTVSQLLLRFRFYTTYGTQYVSIRSIQYDGISYSNDSPHHHNPFESRKVLCTSSTARPSIARQAGPHFSRCYFMQWTYPPLGLKLAYVDGHSQYYKHTPATCTVVRRRRNDFPLPC